MCAEEEPIEVEEHHKSNKRNLRTRRVVEKEINEDEEDDEEEDEDEDEYHSDNILYDNEEYSDYNHEVDDDDNIITETIEIVHHRPEELR